MATQFNDKIKRVALMPYALRGHEWWRRAGDAVGFHRTGGYTLAFNAREQALLLRNDMPFHALAGMEYALSAIELIVCEIALAAPSVNAQALQTAKAAVEAARSLPSAIAVFCATAPIVAGAAAPMHTGSLAQPRITPSRSLAPMSSVIGLTWFAWAEM